MEDMVTNKGSEKSRSIFPLEFDCQAPLKFYEHCQKCARFSDDCHYLKMGLELLLREKELCHRAGS
jgi:hypothetical protein